MARIGEADMKRFYIGSMLICVILQVVSPVWARPSMAQIRYLETGYLEIPEQVNGAEVLTELDESLTSKRAFVRAAAVRRLGELCGEEGIPQLIEIFRSEQPVSQPETWPVVKMEVVRTIGRMKGAEASKVLASLLKEHWERRPADPNRRDISWLVDDCPVIHYLLEEAYPRVGDETVFKVVEEVVLEERLPAMFVRFKGGIGDLAWMVYLNGLMARNGIVETRDRVDYLMRFREKTIEGQEKYTPAVTIKVRAAQGVLSKCELSGIQGVLEEIRKEMESRAIETDSPEYKALKTRAAYLDRLITLRAQEESKHNTDSNVNGGVRKD